jgi:hypothetical protein
MKKRDVVSKHDIIREIKMINKRLNDVFSGLQVVSVSLRDYVEFKRSEKKFTKFLKKKYGDIE